MAVQRRERTEEGQIGLVAMVVTLALVGTLTAVALGVTLSGPGSGDSLNSSAGVGTANDVAAKTALQNVVMLAQNLAAAGGYSKVSPSALAGSGATVTTGATTSPTTVSIAVGGGASAPAPAAPGGGSPTVTLPGGITLPPNVTAPPGYVQGAGDGSSSSSSGSLTLATYSNSGTCWYAWLGGGLIWYGAQTMQHSCQAAPLLAAPSAATPSPTAIGWQEGSFPVG